jgi:anti-sigma factor RsiW
MRWPWQRKAPGLECQEVVELVNDYIEGALGSEDAKRFEAHLAACDACSTYIEQIRQTITITGRLTEEALEPHVRDELLAAFRGWNEARGT